MHLQNIMGKMAELYDPPLDSTQLIALGTEEDAEARILSCPDCFWAVFSVNAIDLESMYVNYTWRVHIQFLNDQESGMTKDRLYDDIIAENMMEQALINYFANTEEIKQKRKHKITAYKSEIAFQNLPDIQYFPVQGIYNKIASGAPVVLGISCIFSLFAFSYQIT